MHVQGRINPHFTNGAKPRSTMAERPVRPISSTPTEALHFLSPTSYRFKDSLRPTSAQSCHICRRNMTDRQEGDAARLSISTSWNPSVPNLESGSISRSSQGVDPGSILVNSFLWSKARRPNASSERDKSRSTTPREHISFENILLFS